MNFITIDFETYYDKEYSLSKLTTEQYIRDDRFEVIGVAVKVNHGNCEWFSGGHNETKEFLQRFNWENSIAIAHNAMFDGAILSWIFDIHPKGIADTLSMARTCGDAKAGNSLKKLAEKYEIGVKGTEVLNALGKNRVDFSEQELNSYGGYCVNDVEITYKLFCILNETVPVKELKLIDLTILMFTEPVLILDTLGLEQHLAEVRTKKDQLLNAISVTKEDLMSNVKFAAVLDELGIDAPMKVSPTTGKLTYAFAKTDEAFKNLPERFPPESPLRFAVDALVSARLGLKSTLEETRTERFIGISTRGKFPVPLSYYAAHTGRWGGADKINIQNLPSRGNNAGKLKSAILAPKGQVIIDCDSAQIEARVLAWLAEQDDLVEAFRKGEDVYKIMASAIYNKPREKVTTQERFVGKTTVLGCGYGMGKDKFKAQLKVFGVDITIDNAAHIVDTYRRVYPKIPELWRQADNVLRIMYEGKYTAPLGKDEVFQVNPLLGGIVSPNGMVIKYLGLSKRIENNLIKFVYQTRTGMMNIYGGKVIENVVQHLARCVIGEQMLKISKRYRVVFTVHDAIACIAPEAEAEEARAHVEECMRYTPTWAEGLPLACESGVGKNYGEC